MKQSSPTMQGALRIAPCSILASMNLYEKDSSGNRASTIAAALPQASHGDNASPQRKSDPT
jgi:hypothetical protein